jgi:rhodanese-related sulfurtransferase
VDAAGFVQLVNTPGVVVLDVRTPAEFASGHLEGAVNIDIESQDFATRVGELDRSVTYAVYCRSGNRSAAALTVMKELGFTGLHHLAGGIGAWQRAGQPVVR